MRQKYFYLNSYAKFAKKTTKNNSHILSARYKFLTYKYKYICKDICEKLSLNKSGFDKELLVKCMECG